MTQQKDMIAIDFGGSAGIRQLPYAEVQRIIHGYLSSSNYAAAVSMSMQLVEQRPNDFWPHLVAAESFHMHQQVEPALRHINRALEIDPRNIVGLIGKARICLFAGDREQAVQLMDTALSLAPESSKLLHEKATLLMNAGDIDGARDSYRRSVELDARNAPSLLGLSRLPGNNFSDELIELVESIIQSGQLAGEDLVQAHFALAHVYDKSVEVARHFTHLDAGNELKSHSLQFDSVASTRKTQQTVEFFSAEFFAQRAREGGNPARIIFIVGFPRCGSTLVEQILCSHPDVSGAGEILALNQAIQGFAHTENLSPGFPLWVDQQPMGALTAIADGYMHRVEQFNQSTCLTDKFLDNYLLIGLIHLIFPNAKIVHVQRNPIDVCYSCYKHLFYFNSLPFTYDLDHLASKYRDYQQVMNHWNQVLPGKVHVIEYEQLISQQEKATRDLLEYCELPWDEGCMNFHESTRAVHTTSSSQVRQRLYTDSVDRWKFYRDHLQPLMGLTNP